MRKRIFVPKADGYRNARRAALKDLRIVYESAEVIEFGEQDDALYWVDVEVGAHCHVNVRTRASIEAEETQRRRALELEERLTAWRQMRAGIVLEALPPETAALVRQMDTR